MTEKPSNAPGETTERLYCGREEAAAFLSDTGYPMTAGTLRCLAGKGTGPAYRRFGRHALYRISELLPWAENRPAA